MARHFLAPGTPGAILLCLSVACSATRPTHKDLPVGYVLLFREARRIAVPVYPPESLLERNQGLAVAEVKFAPSGDPVAVGVLAAPDKFIRKAVYSSSMNWRLSPITTGKWIRKGKLFFYFLSGNPPHVYLINNPEEKQRLIALMANSNRHTKCIAYSLNL